MFILCFVVVKAIFTELYIKYSDLMQIFCKQLYDFMYFYLTSMNISSSSSSFMMSCRQHGYPWPSLATSPYRSSPLAGLQGYIPYSHRGAVCIFEPAFAQPYVGVHRSTSLMNSSLLLQQCPVCLVRLTGVVFVMGGRWPYSWRFEGCCLQDLFNIARNIIV